MAVNGHLICPLPAYENEPVRCLCGWESIVRDLGGMVQLWQRHQIMELRDWPRDEPSGPLTDDEREEITGVLWDWYGCFVRAGFQEHQAMSLVRSMLTDGL